MGATDGELSEIPIYLGLFHGVGWWVEVGWIMGERCFFIYFNAFCLSFEEVYLSLGSGLRLVGVLVGLWFKVVESSGG